MASGLVSDEGSVFVEIQPTAGVFVPPSAGASAIEVLSDGVEFVESRENLPRNNRTSTVEKVVGKLGQKSMTGAMPIEWRAGSTEGAEPESKALYESLLGGKRSYVSRVSLTGHSTSTITLAVGEAVQYSVGDIVKMKEFDISSANPDHTSPIDDITGDVITLKVPYFQAFADNVVIAAGTTFFHASGAPMVSIRNFIGGKIKQDLQGGRPVTGEMANFATGQLPTFTFNMEALSYGDRAVATPAFTPVFDTSTPPVTLCANVIQNTTILELNELSFSLANTLGFLTSTSSKNGKISSRITELVSTFTINPYTSDSDVDQFDRWDQSLPYSIFASSHNDGASSNEHLEVVAVYFPNCRSNEISTGDLDGIASDEISGEAFKDLGNDSVFLAFI